MKTNLFIINLNMLLALLVQKIGRNNYHDFKSKDFLLFHQIFLKSKIWPIQKLKFEK